MPPSGSAVLSASLAPIAVSADRLQDLLPAEAGSGRLTARRRYGTLIDSEGLGQRHQGLCAACHVLLYSIHRARRSPHQQPSRTAHVAARQLRATRSVAQSTDPGWYEPRGVALLQPQSFPSAILPVLPVLGVRARERPQAACIPSIGRGSRGRIWAMPDEPPWPQWKSFPRMLPKGDYSYCHVWSQNSTR